MTTRTRLSGGDLISDNGDSQQVGNEARRETVSVVIPCYNGEEFVADAIDSALAQTYPYKEVIVVDDGSTDGSLDVIKSFSDAIRWETRPNRGGCAARNRGIELARGEFVQFLDADDLLHADKLARQVAASKQQPDAIVYCDHVAYLSEHAATPERRGMACEGLDSVVFVLKHRTMQTSAPLHRKEWLLQAGGFRNRLRASQEFDLHLRLAAAGRNWVHLPEALFTVRRRADSVSADTGRTLAAVLEFLPEIVQKLQRGDGFNEQRAQAFAEYAARCGRLCLRCGQTASGLSLLKLSQSLHPTAGDRAAYGLPARLVKQTLGPLAVERVANMKRFLRRMTNSF